MRNTMGWLLVGLGVACSGGGDDGTGDDGAGEAASTDGTDGSGGSDGADGADGMDGSDGADGSDGTGGTGPDLQMATFPTAPIVQTEEFEGVVEIGCALWTDGALSRRDDAVVTVTPAEGATVVNHSVTFSEPGDYTVTCTDTVDGSSLSADARVVAVGEVIGTELLEQAAMLGETQHAIVDVFLANDGPDVDLVAAYDRLGAVEGLAGEAASVVRNLPEAFWPTTEELVAAGIARNADDDALVGTLTELSNAISATRARLAAIDPTTATEADLELLAAKDAELEAAANAFAALEPSFHGWTEASTQLSEHVLAPAAELVAETAAWHRAQLEAEAAEVLPPFGLLGFTMGTFAQSSLRVNLASKIYGDAISAIDMSINNLVLMELIDLALPATGALSMDFVYASSSVGYAVPGYATTIHGSGFSSKPGMNQFFIVGVEWQGTVDSVLAGCGLGEGSMAERLENAQNCLDALDTEEEDLYSGAQGVSNGTLSAQQIDLGPFPSICGDGWLPVTVGIKAFNMETGDRTDFWELNCLP